MSKNQARLKARLEAEPLIYAMTHVVRYHESSPDREFAARMVHEFCDLGLLPSPQDVRRMREVECSYYASGASPGSQIDAQRKGLAA